MTPKRRATRWPAALAVLLLVPAAAAAQGTRFGVGYVARPPEMLLGGAAWVLPGALSGWGLYVDGKTDIDDPSSEAEFDPDLTAAEVERLYPDDEEYSQEDRWNSFNLAVMRTLTPELTVYLGGGYSHRDVYRRYLDPERNRGRLGLYWVEDPEAATDEVNVLGGVLLRVSSRLQLQFGAESAPRGFAVGASLVFGGR